MLSLAGSRCAVVRVLSAACLVCTVAAPTARAVSITLTPFANGLYAPLRSDDPTCFEATFPAASFDADDAAQFKAKIP